MKLVKEFREFINRGNMFDMAVGIIVGGAFTTLVNKLIASVITPIIKVATGGKDTFTGWAIHIPHSNQVIDFGAFFTAVINFLITAFVVFVLIKAINKSRRVAEKAASLSRKQFLHLDLSDNTDEDEAPRLCPYCLKEISEEATRCHHCTSILPNATDDQARLMTQGGASPINAPIEPRATASSANPKAKRG